MRNHLWSDFRMANGVLQQENSEEGNWRCVELPKTSTIFKVKVSVGTRVQRGAILCLYRSLEKPNFTEKLKSTWLGVVKKVCAKAGDQINSGSAVFFIGEEVCRHQVVIKLICAECGKDLKDEFLKSSNGIAAVPGPQLSKDAPQLTSASISMIHNVPELMVSSEIAHGVANRDVKELLDKKKLVLIVDLDQTLIHTTNDDVPSNLKDVFHFQMHNPGPWYHTKLRPGAKEFLQDLSQFFQLHIITFGVRLYAHIIARFLDPHDKYFHNRIMARDEIHCFGSDKTANISSLFPMGDEMVCVIDDRDDVWRYMENVIKVPAYRFFPSTGDINDPKQVDLQNTTCKEKMDPKLTKTKSVKQELKYQIEQKIANSPSNVKHSIGCNSDFSSSEVTEVGKNESSNGAKEKRKNSHCSIGSKAKSKRVRFNLPNESSANDSESAEAVKKSKFNRAVSEMKTMCKDDLKSASSSDAQTSRDAKICDSPPPQKCTRIKKKRRSIFDAEDICQDCENNVRHNCKFLEEESKQVEAEISNKESKIEEFSESTKPSTVSNDHPTNDKLESSPESKEVEWEDSDDFLPDLKQILLKVHKKFYQQVSTRSESASTNAGSSTANLNDFKCLVPNVKDVINSVKSEVLKGCVVVFSAVVPTNFPLKRSREFLEATSLGAVVCDSVDVKKCTHVIAARHNTHKVSQARKNASRNIKIVSPDWLWACSQRWQRANEDDFTLEKYDPARSLKNFWIPNPRSNIKLSEETSVCAATDVKNGNTGEAWQESCRIGARKTRCYGADEETQLCLHSAREERSTKDSSKSTSCSESQQEGPPVDSELNESSSSVPEDEMGESSSSSESDDQEIADEFDIDLIESKFFDDVEKTFEQQRC